MMPLDVVKSVCEEQVGGLQPISYREFLMDKLTHPSWVGTTLVKYQNGKLVNAY